MHRKRKTLLNSLKYEKEIIEKIISRLQKEKEDLNNEIKRFEIEKTIDGLIHEKEELEERIDRLQKEKEDVDGEIEKLEIEEIIGGLRCPKSFICYETNYEELCKVEYVARGKILRCLEETPESCKFSLLCNDTYNCECPLRHYIAEKIGK